MSAPADDVFARQGFGAALGVVPPIALLLVDFVEGFADPEQFGGGNIAAAIDRSTLLLQTARRLGWPVAHSRIVFADDGADANIFSLKAPTLLRLTEASAASAIVPTLAPLQGEHIVRKTQPSAFFGTNLAPWLTQKGVRTLVVAGCVTSGCVRASVVDAMCHGFRPMVIRDCVGDRSIDAHDASLFDMSKKYADVMPLEALFAALSALPESG